MSQVSAGRKNRVLVGAIGLAVALQSGTRRARWLTQALRPFVGLRDDGAGALRQQRRMKQAVQFIHKDSADLLPLDGLKKLGTSKDTQPHSILQRRLMETNLSKLRSGRGTWAPKNDIPGKPSQTQPGSPGRTEEEELIVVSCQCAGKELKAVVDTGSQFNLISSACLDRLGGGFPFSLCRLSEHLKAFSSDEERVSLPHDVRAIGRVDGLVLALGAVSVECAALVVEDNEKPFSLGLQTLKSLKCIINMEKQHLVLGQAGRAEIPFAEGDAAAAAEREEEPSGKGSSRDLLQRSDLAVEMLLLPLAAEELREGHADEGKGAARPRVQLLALPSRTEAAPGTRLDLA
ncbi:PREDICTED: nuclear receptor-interacting protein 3 [Tinamus guttatus]|uniref:nuclear receptor-interacting protein 3 n=1 Tax=Tinamus guttatus TaxID=94827 RepID=UPI00052F33F5|nr:PREDICTED: nuclear receptor-interacting protein 3 [Tinamus guttatus]